MQGLIVFLKTLSLGELQNHVLGLDLLLDHVLFVTLILYTVTVELKMGNAIQIVLLLNLMPLAHLAIKIVNTVLEVHSLNAQSVIHLNF